MTNLAFTSPVALGVNSFASRAVSTRPQSPQYVYSPRRANVSMISKANIEKKANKVALMKERIAGCQLLFSVPLDGLTVSQTMELKLSLPEGTGMGTIKNTLMRRAVVDSEWEIMGDLNTQSSLWFFVKEDMKGSVEAYEKFAKATKRENIKGGVFEGTLYDENGIESLAALPSKKELIAKIARSLKILPAKVARGINMVPTKMGRAIQLAFAEEGDKGESSD